MQSVMLVSSKTCGWGELRQLVQQIPDTAICGEATSAAEACGLASAVSPTAILCAGRLDRASALPLLLKLREIAPHALLAVVDFEVDLEILAALNVLRLAGYFLWGDQSVEALQRGLAAVLTGEIVAGSYTVIAHVISALGDCSSPSVTKSCITLNTREEVVLHGLLAELSYAEIARNLHLSERTIARCVKILEKKLGVSDRFTLGARANDLGIVLGGDWPATACHLPANRATKGARGVTAHPPCEKQAHTIRSGQRTGG